MTPDVPRADATLALFDTTPPRPGGAASSDHLDERTASHIDWRLANPLATDTVQAALRARDPALEYHRPGEGPPTEPGGPVDWHQMHDDEHAETLAALTDFLTWALPRWGFTTEQIPANCWWQHPDILEELTAWWGLWQACIRNPTAHITDQSNFQERTHALKQRLEHTYRGRCRHEHTLPSALSLSSPELSRTTARPVAEPVSRNLSTDDHAAAAAMR